MQGLLAIVALALVTAFLGGILWFFTFEVDPMDPDDEDDPDDDEAGFSAAMARWRKLEGME